MYTCAHQTRHTLTNGPRVQFLHTFVFVWHNLLNLLVSYLNSQNKKSYWNSSYIFMIMHWIWFDIQKLIKTIFFCKFAYKKPKIFYKLILFFKIVWLTVLFNFLISFTKIVSWFEIFKYFHSNVHPYRKWSRSKQY